MFDVIQCAARGGKGRKREKPDKAINARARTRLYDVIQRLARREQWKTADRTRVILEERVAAEEQSEREQTGQTGR